MTLIAVSVGQMPENIKDSLEKSIIELSQHSPYIFALPEGVFDASTLDSEWFIQSTYAIGAVSTGIHLCLDEDQRKEAD
ncbi:hypothetical protein GCM10017783_20190 [Deinococcus piscis]|uniref:Uncharacterized protein n=1 Tax=Deinococcus piscis TaxID=394230 RepID=A0ABQ3KEV8_9DEIO|nr:hypothetical protein GCM10017783_20190 [Deinococcus piscis]